MNEFYDSNRFSVHSNSKGNLLKTEYVKDGNRHFVKTGRLQLRDFPGRWGIEPIIEVICFRLGRLLGLRVAEQSLHVLSGTRYNKEFTTFISDSPDFRNGRSVVFLQTLYVRNNALIDLEQLCRVMNGTELMNMLAFDLIIMNEDRHNGNIAWLVDDSGTPDMAPVFDNGYSLLYDDIKGMITDFRKAAGFCLCNSPLYTESFKAAERLFERLSKQYPPTINLDPTPEKVHGVLEETRREYEILKYENTNNVGLCDEWWWRTEEFINWRLGYVRDLRYNMER